MKTFDYTLKSAKGIHVRPTVILQNMARMHFATIIIQDGDKTANIMSLAEIINLRSKQGNEVTVSVTSKDEETFATEVEEFFEMNF